KADLRNRLVFVRPAPPVKHLLREANRRESMSDRRQQDEIDEIRIELRASAGGDDLERRLRASAAVVPARACDVIEGAGNSRDPRLDRNAPPAKAAWIPGTVPILVVGKDAGRKIRIERLERREHVRAARWMRHDCGPFGTGEGRPLMHNVVDRAVNLADVVKERDALHGALALLVETEGVSDHQRTRGGPS